MVQGSVWVEQVNPANMLTDVYRSVSVTYRYLVMVGVNAVQFTETASDTASGGDYNARVYIYKTDIYHMVNATFTFKADIPCSYGTQPFRPNPVTVPAKL